MTIYRNVNLVEYSLGNLFTNDFLFQDQITSVEIIFMVCNFLFYQEKITAIRKQYFFYKWLAANITKLPPFVLEYQRFKKVSDMMNNFTDVCFEEKCDLCTSSILFYVGFSVLRREDIEITVSIISYVL